MNLNITQKDFESQISKNLSSMFGLNSIDATYDQYYKAVAVIVRGLMSDRLYNSPDYKGSREKGSKTIYYMCMEFLIGRSLQNNLYNLGIEDIAKSALENFNIDIGKVYDCEPNAGLGNGGLGRLAACYMDALTSNDYTAVGYSILYEYGIFKQKLEDGWQTELPDFWLPGGEVWLTPKKESGVTVNFGGQLESKWNDGYYTTKHTGFVPVTAVPYDMYISGKGGKSVNVLRLWQSTSPGIDMILFNQGDYIKAVEQDAMAEMISKVLYPADDHDKGKELRLKQQYFLVSASIQDIVKRHLQNHRTVDNIPDEIAIHINDTHPALAIPEMIRIFLDDCGYSWNKAWDIVTKTFAYTNHTVMKEALECWGKPLVQGLIPRIYEIIKEIDNRLRSEIWEKFHDSEMVERMAIISGGTVRMANLCVACCQSVNGVSALHSEILKDTVFKDFYAMSPGKFKNVTIGIAYRRWLCQSNPKLAELITELIGDGFIKQSMELERLKDFKDDTRVLERFQDVKNFNKKDFVKYVQKESGITIDPGSIYDVQVKRLHEYKRQHLNTLDIIAKYLTVKDNPSAYFHPVTYIFAAKAAPGYFMAKKIINLICSLAKLINNDKDVAGRIKIVFLEDYNVTTAERLMPCADISEQISLAGTEASGTGNMKLMLNGAVTIGTLDGANVEIKTAVGDENIFIFGMNEREVQELKNRGYNPMDYYLNNQMLHRIIDFINGGLLGDKFPEITSSLIGSDPYMVLADFDDYHNVRENMVKAYSNKNNWNKMSMLNVASAGIFSADRAVNEYARIIWNRQKFITV
ncbi:MAG: glycogen/starch/alpha-glucan phosphorylase [Oscillospiraceae bacterium]|jgi:starch phosphorylase|nr:glycogen/starch/alpha-glucan phosphorylase [Oscillospiraceae bacterium]